MLLLSGNLDALFAGDACEGGEEYMLYRLPTKERLTRFDPTGVLWCDELH